MPKPTLSQDINHELCEMVKHLNPSLYAEWSERNLYEAKWTAGIAYSFGGGRFGVRTPVTLSFLSYRILLTTWNMNYYK